MKNDYFCRRTKGWDMLDKKNAEFGRNYFKVSEEDIRCVLAASLEKGGDYADLYFQHTVYHGLQLLDGTVNNAQSNVDFGVGVRVLKGDQTGYAYVENLTKDEMLSAARVAAQIADCGHQAHSIPNLTEKLCHNDFYPIETPWDTLAMDAKIPFLQKMNDLFFESDKRVVKVNAVLSDAVSHVFFCNSEGEMFYDYRPIVSISATCILDENGKIEKGVATRSFRMGAEFLTDGLMVDLVQSAIRHAALSLIAVKPKGGEMPVVMAAGGSGILLHEAIGHAFEADFNRKGISIFSDMLHKQICNSRINVVDDATIMSNRGAVNMDDEGVEGQKTYIVKDGVLTSYLHDRISANYYHVQPTGNGRRESFRQAPIPRMRATYMEGGDVTEEEIISSVKQGIYACGFTNGQVQIGAGDFTFYVSNGFFIENGKLTQPIKDVNIIGNGPRALADISMVGNNSKIDNGRWTCGKDGQSVPVTCGMPSVLVDKLTVGGEI
ncbi:MAG TPA: peptidase U62 [Parabacteroides sp.]|nr:peptidase U62 [Parabacteroides sp.]